MEEENNNNVVETVEPTTEAGSVEEVSTTQDTEPEVVEVPKDGAETTNEKTMSQNEINGIIKRRVDRALKSERAKYEDLVNTMKVGMGVDSLDEVVKKTKDFYKSEGYEIPETPKYSDEDEKILADYEAKQIIALGEDEIVSVTDDMEARIDKLNAREKLMYDKLKAERTELENRSALHKIGVKDSEIDSDGFKEFAKKFDKSTPLTEVYQMYAQLNEKPAESIGDMQSTLPTDEVKDYYSPEDFDHLTEEQRNNPKIWAKVKESMQRWA